MSQGKLILSAAVIALLNTSCIETKISHAKKKSVSIKLANTINEEVTVETAQKPSDEYVAFQKKHPLALYIKSDVQAGKVKGKTEEHLKKYVDLIFNADNKNLIERFVEEHGDFGIPGELPSDKKLLEFLSYSSDHIRVPYLHIGTTNTYKHLRFTWHASALKDLWIYHDSEVAREKYVIMLKYTLRNLEKMSDQELADKIDKTGLRNMWHPLMKSAALYYGQLFEATGDEKYAKRSILILSRFGQVFDSWPIHFQRNHKDKRGRGSRLANGPLPIDTHYGLWGFWGDTHDLSAAKPLLDAYLLIENSDTYKNMTEGEQNVIVEGLLYKTIEKHTYYKLRPLHNQNMNRVKGMLYFGLKLNRPDYIHTGVRWINDILHISYRRDGLWCEGTPSYGYPITKDIINVTEDLKGYSDPDGYVDAVDNKSFKNFDPEKEFGYNFKRMKKAFDLLALPNGQSMAYEDSTWNFKNLFFDQAPTKSEPFLLGAAGVGMLGFGEKENQNRLYMHWEGRNGHDHCDVLGITLWSHNEEIISETAYRGNRAWQISTAAHNTVVIDGKDQSHFNTAPRAKKKTDKLYLYPQYEYNDLWWGPSSRYDDGGNMTLWNSTEKDIQVMEVDGKKSYGHLEGIETYKRTLALVKTDEENFYIVDVFRVKGGETHDWMLHGNLSQKYKIAVDTPNLTTKEGKIGKYLDNIRSAKSNDMFTATFAVPGTERPKLQTTFLGSTNTEIMVLDGPGMRLQEEPSCWGKPGRAAAHELPSKGKSEFLCVRRKGPESVFVAIHQAFGKTSSIQEIVPISNSGTVKLQIKLQDRTDTLELTENSQIKVIQETNSGKVKTVSFGGKKLTGKVVSASSVDRGDKNNSFTVTGSLPAGKKLAGEVIFITDGDGRNNPYIIKHIEHIASGQSVVYTERETGMIIEKNLLVMTFYPSWDIKGEPTYLIPGKKVR